MALHSKILIDKKPGITRPFKTRQDVMEQVNEVLDLMEMGKIDKAEYEAQILYHKMDIMLEKMILMDWTCGGIPKKIKDEPKFDKSKND